MPLAGGGRQRIATRQAVLQQIEYAADGKTIYFTGYENDTLRLYRVAAAGGAVTQMIDGRAHDASVSPDGRHIAFGSRSAETMSSSLGIVTGSALRTLDLKGGMYRWHPRGDAISFVREENGRMDLWLQPLSGGAP
ncbi:MAG TPA: hypothetical protein VHL59_06445, partial [Thermoanaerobaculia bacterium]|nr:hypothetical protein [Thermoanaerobaculia bacterium]